MSSSSGEEQILTSSTEANAPESKTMDAKLMVATASGSVQHLKDMVKKQESQMMVVVMAKQAAPVEKYRQGNMDPHLLALASSGSSKELRTLLNREDSQASGKGSLPASQARPSGDTEANDSILAGKTAEGDTALHVVAASGQGDNLCTRFREAKHLLFKEPLSTRYTAQQNKNNNNNIDDNDNNNYNNKQRARTEHHALTTYGDGANFLESAGIIYVEAKHLLLEVNNEGNTPLHCAARAGKSNMVKCLIDLVADEGEGKVKELLRKENEHKETALHEAVRVGNSKIVSLLMDKDSELASFPQDGGTSPMYLAIMLRRDEIVKTLYKKYEKSNDGGKLSFSGPNGQNALHAAILRYPPRSGHEDLTKLLNWNKTHLCPQNKDLTTQRDEKGSTPLHFAAAMDFRFWPSKTCRQEFLEANPHAVNMKYFWPPSICWEVLEANPDALYQPDHAGFFPIHVAASVGASWNVDMFIKRYPGCAGLRDAKGRTFLHVAVEEKKVNVIKNACRNQTLSWIMNMVDNDGNTALHLAVEAGSLVMFCSLLRNPHVNLNVPNIRGETPSDIAEYNFPKDGLYYNLNSEVQIRRALRIAGAVEGARRQDRLLEHNRTVRVKNGESKEMAEALKDSTQTLCIGSVLITTVTFGATFAVPGGYIQDDHNHGGSPVLARTYAFDAFIMANTLAFGFSGMATVGLMYSGSPLLNTPNRQVHLGIAVYLLAISITSLAAAFALGAYLVLAPVTHKTAVAICVLTCLGLLYRQLEFIRVRYLLLLPLCRRRGLWALVYSANSIMQSMFLEYWPLIVIFGWAGFTNSAHSKK